MSEREPPPRHRITIDRVVVDGVSERGVQTEIFRRQVTRELKRLLAQPGALDRVSGGRHERQVVRVPDAGDGLGPTQVARHIVRTLQSSSSA